MDAIECKVEGGVVGGGHCHEIAITVRSKS